MTLTLSQSPDHTVNVGETVLIDDDPYTVTAVKPVRESGVFLDWQQRITPNIVIVTVERFDGNPA